MLTSKTASWIVSIVRDTYPRNKLDAALEALSQFLELTAEDDRPIAAVIEGLSLASDPEKPLWMKEFTDIERFMKELLRLVSPEVLQTSPSDGGHWMLKALYTEAFELFAPEFVLTSKNSLNTLKSQSDSRWYFLDVYQFRNSISHGEKLLLSPARIAELTTSMLVCELQLCYSRRAALAGLLDLRQAWDAFDRTGYCRRIVDGYNALRKQGFSYLDVHWYADSDPDTTGQTINDLRSEASDQPLKLLGEAGTGKSTALYQMEYRMARALMDKKRGVIPVYVALGSLTDEDSPVLCRTARCLSLEPELLQHLMAAGDICLLLDGFNEILDLTLKKKVASEIDSLAAKYPRTRIMLTDRALSRASIPTLVQARRLYLSPITMDARLEYFRRNCPDEACRRLILDKAQEDPAYFESLNTPLKLKQLVDVVCATRAVPEDLLHSYVQHLLEREMNEKKDPNIEYLNVFLQVLALQYQDEFSMLEAQKQLAKCKNALGYTQPDTLQCLKLALDMGLLVSEEKNMLRFASPEYQTYFEFEAEATDLISVLD